MLVPKPQQRELSCILTPIAMAQPNKYDREAILTNTSLPEVYNKLVELAEEFCVLGEINTAKGLVSLLLQDTTSDWQRNQCHHFEPYFAAVNIWPDEIPEKERSEAASDKTATKHALDTDDVEEQDDKGNFQEQIKKVHEYGADASILADALSTAFRLALKQTSDLDEVQNDSRVQEVLELLAQNLYKEGIISRLAGRHELSGLLATCVLARKVPVDKKKIENLGQEVIETFRERFINGRRPLDIESKPMKDVLLELERNTKPRSLGFWEEMEQEPPETLFNLPPATDEQITSLEERLKVTLPDDYKEFLKITNGFGGTWNGFHLDPPLHGVDDVQWSDPLLEISFLEFHENISGTSELKLPESDEWPSSGPTIEIGREDVLGILLITPDYTKGVLEAYDTAFKGSDTSEDNKRQNMKVIEARHGSYEEMKKLEWATIEFHDSEDIPCGTFRQFLENRLRRTTTVGFPDENSKEAGSLAYSCLADNS
ncbi:hypothetical protein FOTG_15654 [Fusarium oxysporum f. sp. vasinfectum 25433]|uniref:Knr4/Smi1-like domain-containing protein n=1 Tax=Fusarium oxysporum f. sp. vasinfectum 25433 TaxID=1089449 RepID=X0KR54_FUSOX|nr:hypothetical protein FOTG_15654 [Fusarium oxysporum f. sp. vasinfectum 25433]